MRLTLVLQKTPVKWLLKQKWKVKGSVKDIPPNIPEPLKERGVEIVAAKDAFRIKYKEDLIEPWSPPDHPDFDLPVKEEDHPDYHIEPIYRFNRSSKLLEGERQALVLTKSQPFYSLPESVNSLIGQIEIPDQDELIQRYIMQANRWDPSKDKLPRRFDPGRPHWKYKAEWGIRDDKKTRILLGRLIRLCQTLGGKYPDLLFDRMTSSPMWTSAHVFYKDMPIEIESRSEFLMTSRRALPVFAGEEVVDESTTHQLPDLYPILPTIDLEKVHQYKDTDNTGWHGSSEYRNPHTLFVNICDYWTTSQRNARMLMYLFANAVVAARQRFGPDVRTLPEPVCVQGVSAKVDTFNMACFQLNTLDLASDGGVKNLVWFDNDNLMYERSIKRRIMLRNMHFINYNPEVFRKLLAMYIYGADLSVQGWQHPEEGQEETKMQEKTRSAAL